MTGLAVLLLSLLGVLLVVVVGTLFGEGTFRDADLLRKILLVPCYNLVLGAPVLPLVNVMLGGRRRRELVL